MLIAAAVRAPTSVAIALFTRAVSAASLVNSPVVRLVSGSCFEAQAVSASAAASPSSWRREAFMIRPSPESAPARGRPAASGRTATSPVAGSLFPRLLFPSLQPGLPVLDLLLGFVLLHAVALLDLAHELVAMAGHLVEFVVGELAPLLLDLALHLLPVTLNRVPVHFRLLK